MAAVTSSRDHNHAGSRSSSNNKIRKRPWLPVLWVAAALLCLIFKLRYQVPMAWQYTKVANSTVTDLPRLPKVLRQLRLEIAVVDNEREVTEMMPRTTPQISTQLDNTITTTALPPEKQNMNGVNETATLLLSPFVDHTMTTIRHWGCDLRDTPLIFVHIGKAGGGMVRARFAAAARNVTRHNWKQPEMDHSYYPIHNTTSSRRRAHFCNGGHPQFFPHNHVRCPATQPLARATACPEPMFTSLNKKCHRGCALSDEHCDIVYMGHNYLGNEVHWLPHAVLRQWWERYSAGYVAPAPDDHTTAFNCSRFPGDAGATRPLDENAYMQYHRHCFAAINNHMNAHVQRLPLLYAPTATNNNNGTSVTLNYGPLYATLPSLRVTILRDPFPWLVSKFFWHRHYVNATCDDLATAASRTPHPKVRKFMIEANRIGPERLSQGWTHHYATQYLLFLCGEDCLARYSLGSNDLTQMEMQAAYNLRHSFAVVGLLNETDTFYQMVNARIAYLNMSLNPHMVGGWHPSLQNAESRRCKARFEHDVTFRRQLVDAVPALAALQRLFELGLHVNRAQLAELRHCARFQ